jgi:hypothetical protein
MRNMAPHLIHYGMHVRWQTYRSQALNPNRRARNDERARLKAVLVESVRVDGQPRQKHITFLGSMSIDRSDMRRFWHAVTARFDQLGACPSSGGIFGTNLIPFEA